ncbi:C2 domain-containing protein [Heracleum sosnowskyi]|uniref:C2 domain-containing protein n=1 Tax=Heracleum sosnowskyi TaxID=360622 RepID=A0AAD8MVJ6_9APIA|nr:C2 domain-containing protein [Heracleum sosnowskyi]
MDKLVVEVIDANDLMPKDGQGSASPFVEVEVEDQRQRTQTKIKDLSEPDWNGKMVFNINNQQDLCRKTIEVTVYNEKSSDGHYKNFLGRVRISGLSVPLTESGAVVQTLWISVA